MRKAPNMISSELKEKISDENFEKVEAFGPYLNFFVNKESLSKNLIEKIKRKLNEKENYGSNKDGEGKNVYS